MLCYKLFTMYPVGYVLSLVQFISETVGYKSVSVDMKFLSCKFPNTHKYMKQPTDTYVNNIFIYSTLVTVNILFS